MKGRYKTMANKAKNIKDISKEQFTKRMNDMLIKKDEYVQNVNKMHVYIASGNKKTGAAVPSVSLIPVYHCNNCKSCKGLCYDLRNDCMYPGCRDKRAINAAILEKDPERYFKEINDAAAMQRYFRWHIGGDIVDKYYLEKMVWIAEENPHCEFLAFTKCFDIVNEYLDIKAFPRNLHIIFSAWIGQKMDNKHNLPTSNPLFANGDTTAHDGAQWCGGNCTECARIGVGCWTMKSGDEVIFPAH